MDLLKKKLAELTDVKVRTNIGVLRELYEPIKNAQSNGYNLKTIYKVIIKKVPLLNFGTFTTTLGRINKRTTDGEIIKYSPTPKLEVKTEKNKSISKTSKDKESRQKNAQALFEKNK